MKLTNADIEQFREKEQPEGFYDKSEVEWRWIEKTKRYVAQYANGSSFEFSTEEIFHLFFKMVKACKGTKHEWKGSRKIAERIRYLVDESFRGFEDDFFLEIIQEAVETEGMEGTEETDGIGEEQ